MKRVVLLALPLLLGITLCAAVLVVGLTLSAPAPATVGPIPAELPGAVDVLIPSPSGSTLHGWWSAGRMPGGGVVVLVHGVRADRRQRSPA